jgi:hypothetical protein
MSREKNAKDYITRGSSEPPYDRLYKVTHRDTETSTQIHYVLMGGAFYAATGKASRTERWRVHEGTLPWSTNANSTYDEACRVPGCEFEDQTTHHWHVNPDSVVTYEFGSRVPIACSCGDWVYRGVVGVVNAKMGCKHMIAVRTYLVDGMAHIRRDASRDVVR